MKSENNYVGLLESGHRQILFFVLDKMSNPTQKRRSIFQKNIVSLL